MVLCVYGGILFGSPMFTLGTFLYICQPALSRLVWSIYHGEYRLASHWYYDKQITGMKLKLKILIKYYFGKHNNIVKSNIPMSNKYKYCIGIYYKYIFVKK